MKLRINKNIKPKDNNELSDNAQIDINKNNSSKNNIPLNEVRI